MCHCQNTFWNGNTFARTATSNSVNLQNQNGTWVYGGAYQADVYVRFTPISNNTGGQTDNGTGCGCYRPCCCGCQTSRCGGCMLTADNTNGYGCAYARSYGFGRCGASTRGCGYYNS